jgi:hypothetical protein
LSRASTARIKLAGVEWRRIHKSLPVLRIELSEMLRQYGIESVFRDLEAK